MTGPQPQPGATPAGHPPSDAERLQRLGTQFAEALDHVQAAKPFAKQLHQNHVFELALRLFRLPGGIEHLAQHAAQFDAAGLFYGGDWAHPDILDPGLVAHTVRGEGLLFAIEALSELRLLAIAEGRVEHPAVTPGQARNFLESVLAQNLDLVFPSGAEADRAEWGPKLDRAHRLFRFVLDRTGAGGILSSIVAEAARQCAQRPLVVTRVKGLIERAVQSGVTGHEPPVAQDMASLVHALHGPTAAMREAGSPEAYLAALASMPPATLQAEAEACADSMHRTGLVGPLHAVLLRHAAAQNADLASAVLGLDGLGRACFDTYSALGMRMIETAIHPENPQALYGLSCLLNRGTLLFPPVAPGLWRFVELPILPTVADALAQSSGLALPPQAILLGGVLGVLGQPLGIGQGRNPTCQSARAISLWAQSDPGSLLDLIVRAARDGDIVMHFEGETLHSSCLEEGMAGVLHMELDPVSVVLVPHLDRVYAEMSRRVAGRGEDGHKWINPEFHGWWVRRGFASAVNVATGAIEGIDHFLRCFYATYHPLYNGNLPIMYPQPAGIAVTNGQGRFVGWHAVTIQRVALDAEGEMRVYFYNPNNDSRQHWGQGIETSVEGHGEYFGEASLPFTQFASRLYVFHYDEREVGDMARVPQPALDEITSLVRTSWGAHFPWADSGPMT